MAHRNPEHNRHRSNVLNTAHVLALLGLASAGSLDHSRRTMRQQAHAVVMTQSNVDVVHSTIERRRRELLQEARTERLANRPWLGRLQIQMAFLQQESLGNTQDLANQAKILDQYDRYLRTIRRELRGHPTPERMHAVLHRHFGRFPYIRGGNSSNILTFHQYHDGSCKGTRQAFSAYLVDSLISGVGIRVYPGDPHNMLIPGHETTTVRHQEGVFVTEYDIAAGQPVEDTNSIYVLADQILELYGPYGAFEPQFPAPPENYVPQRRRAPIQERSIMASTFSRLPNHQPESRQEDTNVHEQYNRGAGNIFALLSQKLFNHDLTPFMAGHHPSNRPAPESLHLAPTELNALSNGIEAVENFLFDQNQKHPNGFDPALQRQIYSLLYIGYQIAAQHFTNIQNTAAAADATRMKDVYARWLSEHPLQSYQTNNLFNAALDFTVQPELREQALATIERQLATVDDADGSIGVPGRDWDYNPTTVRRLPNVRNIADTIVALTKTTTDGDMLRRIGTVAYTWGMQDALLERFLEMSMFEDDPRRNEAWIRSRIAISRKIQALAIPDGPNHRIFHLPGNQDPLAVLDQELARIARESNARGYERQLTNLREQFLFEVLCYPRFTNPDNPYGSVIEYSRPERAVLARIFNTLNTQGFFGTQEDLGERAPIHSRHHLFYRMSNYLNYGGVAFP